jgi:hypothetical protein
MPRAGSGDAGVIVAGMLMDGLWDAFHEHHMGAAAGNVRGSGRSAGMQRHANDARPCHAVHRRRHALTSNAETARAPAMLRGSMSNNQTND